jgi:hypothetical protein
MSVRYMKMGYHILGASVGTLILGAGMSALLLSLACSSPAPAKKPAMRTIESGAVGFMMSYDKVKQLWDGYNPEQKAVFAKTINYPLSNVKALLDGYEGNNELGSLIVWQGFPAMNGGNGSSDGLSEIVFQTPIPLPYVGAYNTANADKFSASSIKSSIDWPAAKQLLNRNPQETQ